MFVGTMEELKAKAIQIEKGTEVFFLLSAKTENLSPCWITPSYARKYCYSGEIVSFIDEKMRWYVIPDIGVQDFLEKNGYEKTDFHVPFSLLPSYPVQEKEKWADLLAEFEGF